MGGGVKVGVFHVCGMCFAAVCSRARAYISRHFYTSGRAHRRKAEEMSGEIFLAALVLQIELCNTVR